MDEATTSVLDDAGGPPPSGPAGLAEAPTRELAPDDPAHPVESETGFAQQIAQMVRRRLSAGAYAAPQIDRYVVIEQIGRGGMGIVYSAYDKHLDRKVAIKVLPEEELPGQEDRARFRREAQALAQLSHPHVVTVHDVGEVDGELFLAMEFVEG